MGEYAMEKHFDPYHKWLGIPPEEQPPDLYRLLGVAQFEHDPDVIANAADQRMAHLRTFQTGRNAGLSQQLLNQLAAARIVLLHAQKRTAYDAQLQAELAAKARRTSEPPPVQQQLTLPAPPIQEPDAHASQRGQGAGAIRRGAPPPARPLEPSTSERLNALFENLSVEEKAVLGQVRRSLGKSQEKPGQHREPLDPETRQRRRQIAVGVLIAALVAVSVPLLGVLLASRGEKPEAADTEKETAVLILRWPESERSGAQLTIDGARATPASSSPAHLEFKSVPGKHHVRIVRDGYLPFDEKVVLEAGATIDRDVIWEPTETAVLVLRWPEPERAGAQLTIDGARATPAGSSPAHLEFKLVPGKHRVRILRDHYLPFDEDVMLKAGARMDRTVVWQPVVESDGTGLWAEYFNGRACEQLIFRRIDPNVQFIWGADSPEERVPADEFSARWTGYLKSPFPGRYKLRAIIDDFMQVWIDGNMVLWGASGTGQYPETEVDLTGQPQTIKIKFWEGNTDAVACLNWLPPGDFVEQAVPPEAFFNEKSFAEKTPVPESILRSAPRGEPPALVVGRPVDVLQLIDPTKHAIQGRWWFDGSSLICCRGEAALIELPCPLPEEYEVRMRVERLDGRDDFALTMAAEMQPFSVVLDGLGRRWSGVELIDGARVDRNETRRSGPIFSENQSRDVHYTVRKSRLKIDVDSQTVIDWDANYRRCSLWRQWAGERPVSFSLGAWNSRFRISKLEFIAIAPGSVLGTASGDDHGGQDRDGGGDGHASQSGRMELAAVPAVALQQQLVEALKGEFHDSYSQDEPVARFALCARLVRRARQKEDPPEKRYVMLAEASRIAANAGNATLAMMAVDEMAGQFKIDCLKCKADMLLLTVRKVRNPAYIHTAAAAAGALAHEIVSPTTYDDLVAALHELDRTALRICGAEASKAVKAGIARVKYLQDLARSWSAACLRLQEFPDDPGASRDVGLYLCLARANWNGGIAYLAKGNEDRLAQSAAQLLENPEDASSQVNLADALWELGQSQGNDDARREFYLMAARHWYGKALPRLSGGLAARLRCRLNSDEPLPDLPFRLDLNGLAGIAFLVPTKASGEVRSTGGFGTFFGRGRLDYDRVPASSYVHEFEISFETPSGSLEMVYGEPHEGAKVCIWWDQEQQKFRCRAYRYRGGTVWWGGDKYYEPRTRLKLTVYANEGSYRLFLDGRSQLGTGVRPMDLRFRMSTGGDTMLAVASNTFRPWTEADAALLRTSIPPTRIEADWGDTAVRLHEANFGLPLRPDLSDAAPYVVSSSGTPMEWIRPGSFRRIWTDDGNAATSVRITRGFWIGRHEVSRMEWARVMGSVDGVCRVEGSPFLPIDGVSWSQAAAFCQALTQMEQKANRLPKGYVYRVPTEAEWEYACRAGSQDDFSVDSEGFWSAETSGRQLHEVAAGAANPWNLHDMHGNVSEWCLDNWTDPPETPPNREDDPVTLPKDLKGDFVLRGGAWWQSANDCSSRARASSRDEPGGYRGFRIVLGPILE